MKISDFRPFVATTLTDPRTAARQLMSLGLPREVSWTALALVAAVNTALLQLMIASAPPETQSLWPSYFSAPLTVFVLMLGMMVIYVHTLFWAGLAVSGKGRLEDLLALIVWLQILRTGAQIVILTVSAALPALGGLLSLAVFAVGIWILFNFVAEAMHLPSLAHALFVLVLALVGLGLGVGLLMVMIGVFAQGSMSNV